MEISNESFNQQILSLAVSGATIQDHIAITLMALEKFNIDTILLGADPWLFNRYNNQLRWKSISDEYKISLKNIQFKSKDNKIIKKANYKEKYLFYEQFLENMYSFLNIRKLDLDIKPNEINSLTKDVILRVGKRVYGETYPKTKKQEKLKAEVIEYSMNKYEFSHEYYTIYKNFITHLVDIHKKEVVLVLSPYHLPSYKLTIEAKPFYLDLEDRFQELSKEKNIKIVGSYYASSIPCDENEFWDDMHPKESCMIKITDKIN